MARTIRYPRILLIGLAFSALAIPLPAQDVPAAAQVPPGAGAATRGVPAKEYRPVNGLENWSYPYDIGGFKPGKYNILVRATDGAGNVAYAEPFNVILDPESDRPVIRIVNPLPLMRSGSDLNIVGTCRDDDAVSRVEVQVDDGAWKPATGTEYWSLLLETASIPDGLHVIRARGLDVKDVESAVASVSFILDRNKPLHTLVKPEFGKLVSGELAISGEVYDANGIGPVAFSVDSGRSWKELKPSLDKGRAKGQFALKLDTRKMDDGPSVVWFRTRDKAGSTGVAVFLFFVDNTKPELEIIEPAEKSPVHGSFAVSGRVFDAVGIESLSWSYGKESGAIELVPGNTFFAKRFVAPASGKAEIVLTVKDATGNLRSVRVDRTVDPFADLPLVTLLEPAPGASFEGGIRFSGAARDDDGVRSVMWRVDAGTEREIQTDGAFSAILDGASEGKHVLSVRAIDVNGLPGPSVSSPLVCVGKAPIISFTGVSSPLGEAAYAPGARISALEGKASIKGRIIAGNEPREFAYAIGDGPEVKLPLPKKAAETEFSIPVPTTAPFGLLAIRVRAADAAGKSVSVSCLVYSENYARYREGPRIEFRDGRMAPADAAGVRTVSLGKGSPLSGGFMAPFPGDDPVLAELVPPTPFAEIRLEGGRIVISARAEGVTAPTMVRVKTSRNHRYEEGPFVFATDGVAPTLELQGPAFGSWVRDSAEIKGSARDSGGTSTVEYAVLAGAVSEPVWTEAARGVAGDFRASVPLAGADGPAVILVRATDPAGNVSRAETAVLVDAQAPVPRRIFPNADAGGTTLFAFDTGEKSGRIASVEVVRGSARERLPNDRIVRFKADVGQRISLVVRDFSGNEAVVDAIQGLSPSVPAPAPPALAELKTGTAMDAASGPSLSLKGADLSGAVAATLPFVDAPDPALVPEASRRPLRVTGALSLAAVVTGLSPDPRKPVAGFRLGSGSVESPLVLKAGKAPGSYETALKIAVLPDGPAELWVRIVDAASGERWALVILDCDATPPAIELFDPPAASPGTFALSGRVSDANGVARVSYEVGTEKGDFEITNGYFSRDFAFPAKAAQAAVTVSAVDGSGIKASKGIAVKYDPVADAPVASFAGALSGGKAATAAPVAVYAYAVDDDGFALASLTVDKDAPAKGEGPGPLFRFDASPLKPGPHSLSLAASEGEKGGGLASKPVSASLAVQPPAPAIRLAGIGKGKDAREEFGDQAAVSGLAVPISAGTRLFGTVSQASVSSTLDYRFEEGAWTRAVLARTADPAIPGFEIPLPETLPYGRFAFDLKAADAAGQESVFSTSFYRVAPARGDALDAEGVYFEDGAAGEDGTVTLADGASAGAFANCGKIARTELVPPVPFVGIETVEGRITLKSLDGKEGIQASPSVLRVTTADGDVFSSRPLRFVVDAAPPVLELSSPATGFRAGMSVRLAGTASDANTVVAVDYSLDMGVNWFPVAPAAKPLATMSFDRELDLGTGDGALLLLLRARDGAGRERTLQVPLSRDTAAPLVTLVAPRPADTVNGSITVSGFVEDSGGLSSIEMTTDGKAFAAVPFAPAGFWSPEAGDGKPEAPDYATARTPRFAFDALVDLNPIAGNPSALRFRAVDKAGNAFEYAPLGTEPKAFAMDAQADKPVVQIQVPVEGEVQRTDFVVSGMAFDDDKVSEIRYRVDGGPWTVLPGANAFSVPFKLADTADNEHVFEAFATDVNGNPGDVNARKFRVSREEPVASLASPPLSVTNREVVALSGTASDGNGIEAVFVSFDNGASYAKAEGGESWKYSFDTRLLEDGVHPVYFRILDSYGTEGFHASLVNVDNAAPVAAIDAPADGESIVGTLALEGRVSDGVIVSSLVLELSSVERGGAPLVVPLEPSDVFTRDIDVSSLAPGWYDLKLIARDRADNTAYVARNVRIEASRKADFAEIVYPVRGEYLSGAFAVDGRVVTADGRPGEGDRTAALLVDDVPVSLAKVASSGWYSLPVEAGMVGEGEHSIRVEITLPGANAPLATDPRNIFHSRLGPWIDITAFASGSFVTSRPWVKGKAGWALEAPDPSDKAATAAYREELALKAVRTVEVSRDGGRTYGEAEGGKSFKYRLETQEYPEGALRLLVRAVFADGSVAVRRRMLTVDTDLPIVTIVEPSENGRFNETIAVAGMARDEHGIAAVEVIVRSGDKASYKLPGFIQGSYLDAHMLGATRWESGLGLSFFEDNVKLQLQIGQGFDVQPAWDNLFGIMGPDTRPSDISRFGGYVLGAKLLANVAYLPFGFLFGPDWDFFSMSFAFGASFTYFSQRSAIGEIFTPPDGKYMVLSAVVGQWEFAKFTLDWSVFKSYGFYLEGGLVFIPSEASTKLEEFIRPNVALGVRIGLF